MEVDYHQLKKFSIQKSFTHEYQLLCNEIEPKLGKGIWSVPSMPFVTDDKLRRAWNIVKKRGIYKLAYLIGTIKKLK
jgi:hypothetical protein